jgi:L-ribulose-5-phosphate 4-epimerase
VGGAYEENTGRVIVERFSAGALRPDEMPGVLVASHGPFAWGPDAKAAVENAVLLEEVARMAFLTMLLDPSVGEIERALLDKHFLRKHGPGAYYGQKS